MIPEKPFLMVMVTIGTNLDESFAEGHAIRGE